jgi:hypothetical protein
MLLDRGRATAKRESVKQANSLSIATELTEPIGDFGERVRFPSRLKRNDHKRQVSVTAQRTQISPG